MSETIKTLRITLLGPGASGKTCLVNAFVNNTCPNVYTPTEDPTLYYRTLRSETDDGLATVLLEIEDTYSSERTDGKDRFGRKRTIQNFIVIKSTTVGQVVHGKDPPLSTSHVQKEASYDPYSKGRMAFILLFDINDPNSFAQAERDFAHLEKRHAEKVGGPIQPVICLVANKIDQDPYGEEPESIRRRAQAWERDQRTHSSGKLPFKFMEVSALEFTGVRRLFRNIVDEVLQLPSLYEDEGEAHDHSADAATSWGGLFAASQASDGGLLSGGANLFGGLSLWGS